MIFRDSRGRFRNSDKTPREVIEAIYEGKKVEIPKIEKVIEGRKKIELDTVTKTGKKRFKFEEIIKYKQGDFFTTEKAFKQAQELKKIIPELEKKEEIYKIKKSKITKQEKEIMLQKKQEELNKILLEPKNVDTFLRWDIIPKVKNASTQNLEIKFRGKKIGSLETFIKELRETINDADANEEGNYDILFEVEEYDDEIRILDFKETDYDEQ